MKNVTELRRKELRSLESRGLLQPIDIVEFATNESTALHSAFEWDDDVAAHNHRLWQARRLVKVYVEVEKHSNKPINAYVSLKSDRYSGGGYRTMVSVLSNKDRRAELLEQAFQDFEYWKRKYNDLKELAPIFEAAEKAKNRKRRKTVRK